jgi:hypothetical protein
MMYKENWLYKSGYNLYTLEVKQKNSACEKMLFDSSYLVGWPIDSSNSVIYKISVLNLMDRTV